jgi:hypothetical protein
MMKNKISFVGLAAGISSLILVGISLFIPWWQLTGGDPANFQVNFSPVNFSLSHSGVVVAIPLILALNIACLLTLLASGIVLTIYAVKPCESYSKQLLGFGYRKPLYIVVAFIAVLIALPLIIQSFAGFSLPVNGSATITPSGSDGSANVSAVLEWPFYFSIVVAGLSVAARLVHGKIAKPSPLPTTTAS